MNKRAEAATLSVTRPALLAMIVLLTGCGDPELSVRDFILPAGDYAAGETSFVDYGCAACHVVAGTDIAYPGEEAMPRIELGGVVRNVKSYGDLLTSIVNPDHALAEAYLKSLPPAARKTASSPMPDFNEQLTVADLIDLVEFLHSRYEETTPEYIGRSYVR